MSTDHTFTCAMSSDSASSFLSDTPTFGDATQRAVWQFVAETAAEAPEGTHESTIYQATVQHMRNEHNTPLTIQDIQNIMRHAKERRKRRKQTEQQAASRRKKGEKENEKWEEELEACRTRIQRQLYQQTTPRPPPPPSGIARTVSLATDVARSSCDALDALKQRNIRLNTRRQQENEEEEEEVEFHQRPALADITQQSNTPMGGLSDQPAVVVSTVSDQLSPASVCRSHSPSPSSSESSSSSQPPSPASSSSSASSSSLSSFPAALLSPAGRIQAQQQKKEMKRKIAKDAAEAVRQEIERRKKQDAVMEDTRVVMQQMKILMPLLTEEMLERSAKRMQKEAKEEKE